MRFLLISLMAYSVFTISSFAALSQGNQQIINPPSAQSSGGEKKPLPEMIKSELERNLDALIKKYDDRWNQYRAAYLICVLLPAFLTSLAGVLPKLRPVRPNRPDGGRRQAHNENIALVLSTLSAFLLIANTSVGFSGASIANRNAREETKLLKYDLLDDKVTGKTDVLRRADEIESKKSKAAWGENK